MGMSWFIDEFYNSKQNHGRTCEVPVDHKLLICDNMCRKNLGYSRGGNTYIEGAPVPICSNTMSMLRPINLGKTSWDTLAESRNGFGKCLANLGMAVGIA